MTVKEYQKELKSDLEKIFHDVSMEWRSEIGIKKYSPRPDITIGPYAIEESSNINEECNDKIDNGLNSFFINLIKQHKSNIEESYTDYDLGKLKNSNQNPRCLIAIEIENTTGNKHIFGSILNAISLGKIGIMIAFEDKKLKSLCSIRNYILFLSKNNKKSIDISNLIILSRTQFDGIIGQHINSER
jgi:hypothetical protein